MVYLQAEAKLRKEKEQKEKEETKYQISSLLLLLGPFRAFGDSIVLLVLPFGLLGNQIVHPSNRGQDAWLQEAAKRRAAFMAEDGDLEI